MEHSRLPEVDVARRVASGQPLQASPPHLGWRIECAGSVIDEAHPHVRAHYEISSIPGLTMLTFSVDGDDAGRTLARVIDESRPRMVLLGS